MMVLLFTELLILLNTLYVGIIINNIVLYFDYFMVNTMNMK